MSKTIEIKGKTFHLRPKAPVWGTLKLANAGRNLESGDASLVMEATGTLVNYILNIVIPEERDALDRHLTENDFESGDELNELVGTAMQLMAGRPKDDETPVSSQESPTISGPRSQVVSLSPAINLPQSQVG